MGVEVDNFVAEAHSNHHTVVVVGRVDSSVVFDFGRLGVLDCSIAVVVVGNIVHGIGVVVVDCMAD